MNTQKNWLRKVKIISVIMKTFHIFFFLEELKRIEFKKINYLD